MQDVTGSYLEDVKYTLHKLRLNEDGNFIDMRQTEQVRELERYVNYPSNPMMKLYSKWKNHQNEDPTDCYGAQLYDGQKCITCQDVLIAFSTRSWPAPPIEAIAQCAPNKRATKEVTQFEKEFEILLSQQKDELLNELSQEMLSLEKTEKKTLEYKEKIQKDNQTDETKPVFKDLLSDDQKKQFKEGLLQLNEISHNPMQWNDQRLKEEKSDTVQSLINILNISLGDFTAKIQKQIKFIGKETVFTERRLPRDPESITLTRLEREQCEDTINVTLSVQGLNHDDSNRTVHMLFLKGECQLFISISAFNIDNAAVYVNLNFANQTTLIWQAQRSAKHSLVKTVNFTITNVKLIDEENVVLHKPSFDKKQNIFKLTLYLSVMQQNNRMLYFEDFDLKKEKKKYLAEDAQILQEHINEGCQIFGHLFIKKVPGNLRIGFNGIGQSAQLVEKQFTASHTINLMEFTDEKEVLSLGTITPTTNTLDRMKIVNYYIKLVNSVYESIWGESSQIYSYTSHNQKFDSLDKLPSITFRYEFDGISMRYSPSSGSMTTLLISILAIIGGIFAVSKLGSKILQTLEM